jgi:hypothetical protein
MQINLLNHDEKESTTLVLVLDKEDLAELKERRPFSVGFSPIIEDGDEGLTETLRYPGNFTVFVAYENWGSEETQKYADDPSEYIGWLGRGFDDEDSRLRKRPNDINVYHRKNYLK